MLSSSFRRRFSSKRTFDALRTIGLVSGGTALLCGVDAYMQRRTFEQGRMFEEASLNAVLQSELRTGDVLLFNRPILSGLNPFRILFRALHNLQCGGTYDHVGIVIVNRHAEEAYVLENTFHGPQLLPFDERILYSSAPDIVLRRIQHPYTQEKLDRVDLLVAGIMKGRKQEQNVATRQQQQQQQQLPGNGIQLKETGPNIPRIYRGTVWEQMSLFARLTWDLAFSDTSIAKNSRVVEASNVIVKQDQAKELREIIVQAPKGQEDPEDVSEYLGYKRNLTQNLQRWHRKTDILHRTGHLKRDLGAQNGVFPNAELVVRVLRELEVLQPCLESPESQQQQQDPPRQQTKGGEIDEVLPPLSYREYLPSSFGSVEYLPTLGVSFFHRDLYIKQSGVPLRWTSYDKELEQVRGSLRRDGSKNEF